MPDFSELLALGVRSLVATNYAKIETQSLGFNYNSKVIKTFTYCLVDLNDPFRLERFIELLHLILTHFKIYFAVGYILREEGVLHYYYPSIGHSCLLRTAFDIRGDKDLATFKTEFQRGNWLDLNSHLNL